MISCLNEVTLQAYFDGELEPEIAAQVNKHLARCDECAASAFEFERAIELMASAFEDELPESIPSDRLRANIAAALGGNSIPERISPVASFWPRILDASIARLRLFNPLPRGFAYACFGLLALALGLWLVLGSGLFTRKQNEQVRNEKIQQQQPQAPSATPGAGQDDNMIAQRAAVDKALNVGAPKPDRQRQAAAQRHYAGVKRDSPNTLPNERDTLGEVLAETSDVGIFDAGMVRHFEKAQILLRSFRNADTSTEGFTADLAHEKSQSKNLLYRNILLRRGAESSGNLPAEEVLGSLEPVLLDIANLPDQPSPGEVRSIKDRIQKMEIIVVLQVYSAPLTATNYQP